MPHIGPRSRRLLIAPLLLAVAFVGTACGILLLGTQVSRLGPVDARLALRPSLSGGSVLVVPPLGSIRFDSHTGPLTLRASVLQLRPEVARRLSRDPRGFQTLGDDVVHDLRRALVGPLLRALLGGLAVTAALAMLTFRSLRATAACTATALVGLLAAGGLTAATFRKDSVREPRFTGLLTSAPTAVGSAQELVEHFSEYRLALGKLVGNVVELYDVTSTLPTYSPGAGTTAVLHVSDLHLNPAGIDLMATLARQFHVQAVVDTGDLTDHGTDAERGYVASLSRVGVPYVYIRGNHDSAATAAAVARLPAATVLDDSIGEVAGLRLAGIADPRFTPDKTTRADPDADVVRGAGERLAELIRTASQPVDVALVHDPLSATPLEGLVPLVLAGHRHARAVETQATTLLMVGGSTGGAGLRGLEGEDPTPLECSVLYFDTLSKRLQAWDEITLGGLGATSVTVARHVAPARPPAPSPSSSP